MGLRPDIAGAQSAAVSPVRGEGKQVGATPLPGAVLRWLFDAPVAAGWFVLLLHADHLGARVDRNRDGFRDLPLATQFNAHNKWKYRSGRGVVGEVGVGALRETRRGGQLDFRATDDGAYFRHYGTTLAAP